MPEEADNTLADIAVTARANYRTVEEMVVSALREAILAGVLAPGEKLRQEKLAEALAVSRVPVRAALHRLEAEGLVVSSPHRGARVRVLESAELEETYQLRLLLEIFALRSAMERITPDQIDELASMADEIDAGSEGDDWMALTDRFYQRLYSIADRPLTADMIAKLRANIGRYWLSLKVIEHDGSTHRVIVDAMRAADPVVAEEWMSDHLSKVSKELQRRVEERR